MRKFVVLLLVLLCLCPSAHALSLPESDSATPVIITREAENTKNVIVLEEDEALALSQLPMGGSYYGYLDSNGQGQLLEMQWDLENETLSQPGIHMISGTPVLRDGMTLAEGFDGTVTWPVFRQGGDAVLQIAAVGSAGIVDPLLPHHADPATDLQCNTSVTACFTEEGWLLDVKEQEEFYWQWDLSQIDPTIPGRYFVTATLHCPAWAVFPAEYQTVTETVYILPTDRIELCAPIRTASNGNLEFQWIYASAYVTEPVLEQKSADGGWEACPDGWYRYQTDTIDHTDMLYLTLTALPTETPLVLRLRYLDVVDGETVVRITEPITLTVPANIAELIAAANGRVIVDVLNGDRDGGDSGGTDLPDYEQPAPEWSFPEWEPPEEDPPTRQPKEEEEGTVTEIVTDTYTALSGLRLKQLTKLGDTVLFEKQGAAVEIPSHLLEDLELKDRELLEVTILRPTGNAVEVEILADGEQVTDLPGTVIRLPWDPADGTDLQVVDLFGTVIGEAVYEAGGTAWSVIDHPGIYLVLAVAAVQEPSAQEPPVGDPVPGTPEEPESTQTPDAKEPVPELSPAITPETDLVEAEEPVPIVPEEPASTQTPDAKEPVPELSPAIAPEEDLAEVEEPTSTQMPDAVAPVPELLPAVTPEAAPEETVPEPPAAPEKGPSVSPWWPAGLLLLAGLAAFLWRRRRHG